MRLLAAFAGLTCCLFAQETAPVADWRFAHPAPTLVGGVRLKALLDSPLVNSLIAEAAAKDPNSGLMVGMLKGALAGVTDVRFSLLDRGGEQFDAVVMVSGKLDETLVSALSQGKAGARRIDETTVLLGSPEALAEAARRMNEPPSLLKNRALMRGSNLTNHDFWLAGSLPETPMTGGLNVNLRGLALGMTLSDDVSLELAVEAPTAVQAQELVAMVREGAATQPQLGAQIEAVVEETTARLRVKVPASKVAAAVREGIGSQPAVAAAPAAPAPRTVPPTTPPSPPKRKTIVIQGLEGGPKEIPLQR